MRTLIVGEMNKNEYLCKALEYSEQIFEIELVISTDKKVSSDYFECEIGTVDDIIDIKPEYDIVFICSELFEELKRILIKLGFVEDKIKSYKQLCEFVSPKVLCAF